MDGVKEGEREMKSAVNEAGRIWKRMCANEKGTRADSNWRNQETGYVREILTPFIGP